MFVGTSFSILNYDTDFFDLVKSGKVKVHIAELSRLSQGAVHLDDGSVLETDAFCCVTGWKHIPPVRFLPESIVKEIGLPHALTDEEPIFRPELVKKADEEILAAFPRLRNQPVQSKRLVPLLDDLTGLLTNQVNYPHAPYTPWTLYRFMVPPTAQLQQTRDIAFAGTVMNFSTLLQAHIQAIWICSYFDGTLLPSKAPKIRGSMAHATDCEQELIYESLLHARFGKWRYPAGYGDRYPDFVFDAVPYLDQLLKDLGLTVYRKKGWLSEILEPYGPEDYRTLVEEFRRRSAREI